MLFQLCDLNLLPHPWHWPWISRSNSAIVIFQKCECTWSRFQFVAFYFEDDLELGFSKSKFKMAVSQSWVGRVRKEWVWVDAMLAPLFDLEFWLLPMTLTLNFCIFKFKFKNTCISLTKGLYGLNQKRYWSHDLDPGLLRWNFGNNRISGIPSDITLVLGKNLLSFICYTRWLQAFPGVVRNAGVSALAF